MENFSFFDKIKDKKIYTNNKIKGCIRIIKKLEKSTPYSKKIEKLKMDIFIQTRYIVIKNINNYIKYTTNSQVLYDSLDRLSLESEAFIVLDLCIKSYNFNYDFYFYYNKSLMRNFYKLHKKNLREYEDSIKFFTEYKYKKSNSSDDINLNVDFFNVDLDEWDKILIKSKLIGETREEFFNNNPKFPSSKYFGKLKKIKNLINFIKKEDGLF